MNERGLRESLKWALSQVTSSLTADGMCGWCRKFSAHANDCPLYLAQSRSRGYEPPVKWPGRVVDFDYPDWICQNCHLHMQGGMGQPGICHHCRWNKWQQEEQPPLPIQQRTATEHEGYCPMHIGVGIASRHVGYALNKEYERERLFECSVCSYRFLEARSVEVDSR